jgi:hypothetical protein
VKLPLRLPAIGLVTSITTAWWCTHSAALAATFTVTPSVVSNTYAGVITLDIGGLTNGEQVAIQKYFDLNGNGVVDPGEPLADAFKISDGGAFVIGGVTNLNVPFDSNAATGAITTALNIAPPRTMGNVTGQFLFRLSSPVQNFSPIFASLTVTNAALAQSVSGVVYSNGVTPLPGAVVVVLAASPGNNGGGSWAGGAVTDNAGRYRVNLAPGSYMVFPTCPGYYTDQSLGLQTTLTNGMSITNDLFLTTGSLTLSGRVYDSGNSNGVGGILMPIEGGNYLSVAFTDTNGNYTASVAPASWKVKVDSDQVSERAYVSPQDKISVDTSTGSVAGVDIALTKGNALFYGTFTNVAGAPIANIGLSAQDDSNLYQASGNTDANGKYFVAVLGGPLSWYCNPDNSDPTLAGYLISSSSNTNINVGQALQQNLAALPVTAHISGHVQDSFHNPVTGIGIISSATVNGIPFSSYVVTDSSGNYSMGAASGTWNVFANCCGNEGLDNFGLTDLGVHLVTVPPTNAVMNLTLYPYGTPALSQITRFGPSSVGFGLSGASGTNYTILVTTNLTSGSWFTLLVTNLQGNFAYIQDNQATNRQRFYRALRGP